MEGLFEIIKSGVGEYGCGGLDGEAMKPRSWFGGLVVESYG